MQQSFQIHSIRSFMNSSRKLEVSCEEQLLQSIFPVEIVVIFYASENLPRLHKNRKKGRKEGMLIEAERKRVYNNIFKDERLGKLQVINKCLYILYFSLPVLLCLLHSLKFTELDYRRIFLHQSNQSFSASKQKIIFRTVFLTNMKQGFDIAVHRHQSLYSPEFTLLFLQWSQQKGDILRILSIHNRNINNMPNYTFLGKENYII